MVSEEEASVRAKKNKNYGVSGNGSYERACGCRFDTFTAAINHDHKVWLKMEKKVKEESEQEK